MRCKCPFLLLSEKAKACVHMDEYYQCSDMEANPGSPESWCAGAIERQVSERATENACPVCRGEKEVYAGSSVPDGEGFVTCLCCNGSGVKPSPEEVWKLREENLRLSGDLHIAELELDRKSVV